MAVVRITVTSVEFRDHVYDLGIDLHLLPGDVSIDLRNELRVTFEEDDDARPTGPRVQERTLAPSDAAFPPQITLMFTAEFAGGPHAHGVTFDPAIGRITVDDPLPGDHIGNFLLRAVATSALGGASRAEIVHRIHVHQRVQQIWLTPHTLTVPADITDADRYAFTVLARFEDGVVADITDWPHGLPPRNHFTWNSTPHAATISIDADGWIWVAPGQAGNVVDVTLRYQRGTAPLLEAEGALMVRRAWTAEHRIEAVMEPVHPLADRINYLFVAEGFDDDPDARAWFEEVTEYIARQVRATGMFEPWKSIANRLQFFRVFVSSSAAGITYSSEARLPHADEPDDGSVREVKTAKAPSGGAGAWSLREMIHEVGYPTPELSLMDDADLRARLQELYGAKVTEQRIAKHRNDWKRLATRTLLNEQDSLFGLRFGLPPRAQPYPSDPNIFSYHPRRAGPGHFLGFIRNLQAPDGTVVGARWADGVEPGRICVVVRGPGRSRMATEFFTINTKSKQLGRVATPRPGVDVIPMRLEPTAKEEPFSTLTLFIHEASHGFALGDEYANKGRLRIPTSRTDVEDDANLHLEAAVQAPAPRRVRADNIKWGRWLRIRRAAVVEQPPQVAGDVVTITLPPGQTAAFATGAVVRLRTRIVRLDGVGTNRRLRYMDPEQSLQLIVVDPREANRLNLRQHAPALGSEVTFANLGNFPTQETIVFEPRRGRLGGGPEGELPVLAPIVANHITVSGGPLNAPKDDPTRACVEDLRRTQYPSNLPSHPDYPCYRQYVVGLYEGGATYSCGVFHPTGMCLMRSRKRVEDDNLDDLVDMDGPFVDRDLRRLCFICRYALIDVLDPTLHGRFDDDYEKHYPN